MIIYRSKLSFLILVFIILFSVSVYSDDIKAFDDLYSFHFTYELPVFEEMDVNSEILTSIKAPSFIQILETHEESRWNYWSLVELSDGIQGWIKHSMGYPMAPLDSIELKNMHEEFENLHKKVNDFEVPNEPGLITSSIISDKKYVPFSNRFGKFWEFRNNNTFYIHDTSSGGIGEVGTWIIKNGYLVTVIYGTTGYGPGSPLYDEIFYWNIERNDNSIYSKTKLINNNGYEIFLENDIQEIGSIINIDGFDVNILYELRLLHSNLSALSNPNDPLSKIEYFDGSTRSLTSILESWNQINVIGESIISNEKWYYIDSNTDDWLSENNYFFGWIKSEYAQKVFGTLNNSYVRIRERPDLEAIQLGYLHKGQRVEILQRTERRHKIDNMNAYWYKIKTEEGILGWSYGYFIDLD